jgi:hypothetical protein
MRADLPPTPDSDGRYCGEQPESDDQQYGRQGRCGRRNSRADLVDAAQGPFALSRLHTRATFGYGRGSGGGGARGGPCGGWGDARRPTPERTRHYVRVVTAMAKAIVLTQTQKRRYNAVGRCCACAVGTDAAEEVSPSVYPAREQANQQSGDAEDTHAGKTSTRQTHRLPFRGSDCAHENGKK